jgi:hypothetical protein
MTTAATSDVRINVRLTGADAQQFQQLLAASNAPVSELLRAALREYHRAHTPARRNPLELLAGYIGSGEGPRDLSANYKNYLAEALQAKVPLAVHEPSPPPLHDPRR